MNTIVNFEIAKLLKEKGFYFECRAFYLDNKLQTPKNTLGNYNDIKWVRTWRTSPNDDTISAPLIAEVIMWLYEEHEIWISVELTDNTRDFYFQPTIWNSKDREHHDEDMIDQAKSICKWKEWRFNTAKDAYQSAIEYCLKEIIK